MTQSSGNAADGKRISVSIIEDNWYVREGWEAVLTSLPDFEVLGSYPSCEEAFGSPAIGKSDIVLMDIGLPGMTGIEGVKHLRAHFPDVAVIMCTVHDDNQNVFDAICAGAVGYLLKKMPPEELIHALRDCAAGGSPISPNIARKVLSFFQNTRQESQGTPLSEREREVLDQMALGKSYAAIAHDMALSVDGIRYHIRHIYQKLQVHSRSEAIVAGLKNRLVNRPR